MQKKESLTPPAPKAAPLKEKMFRSDQIRGLLRDLYKVAFEDCRKSYNYSLHSEDEAVRKMMDKLN